MFYDPLTYIIPLLTFAGMLVLVAQRRYSTAAFAGAAASIIVYYIIKAAMFERIAIGDGFGSRFNNPDYQPGDQPDWGWVNYAPEWVLNGPLYLAIGLAVVGVLLVIASAVLRELIARDKIPNRAWFWPVGHQLVKYQAA